jgi:hypothetical protein
MNSTWPLVELLNPPATKACLQGRSDRSVYRDRLVRNSCDAALPLDVACTRSTPFLPISDPFNGALKRPTQKPPFSPSPIPSTAPSSAPRKKQNKILAWREGLLCSNVMNFSSETPCRLSSQLFHLILRITVPVFQEFSSSSTPLPPATPFLPISDPFNGALKRPTQKANS